MDSITAPTDKLRPGSGTVVTALGVTQILAWGSSYYLLAVLAEPIAADTGWSPAWIVGALSMGLLIEGLAAPTVGAAIERHGGRYVLAASSVFLGAGLAGLAAAPSLPVYVVAWIVTGIGMGAGLYEAAFSTLGRLYGMDARRLISLLTLFGGLASTICWPLTALLNAEFGWRGACLAYAVVQFTISLPFHLWLIPREALRSVSVPTRHRLWGAGPSISGELKTLFILLATSFALTSSIASAVSVHLIVLLTESGMALAVAVGLAALMGPSQVAARIVELASSRHLHPVWSMAISSLLIVAGLLLLWLEAPLAAMAVIIYGCGMGIRSIVKGTMPLVVFGVGGYAVLMGRLAMPSLVAGAAAPFLGAMIFEQFGGHALRGVLLAAALLNLALVAAIWRQIPPKIGPSQPL
jgi:predicted MFS family arabinose efflux permease